MRGNKRKVVVELIDGGKVNNARLVEFFAKKFNEMNMNNENI